LPFSLNGDLSLGFTVSQVAEKHGWPEPMVWALALEKKDDFQRFEALGWELFSWNLWEWDKCDNRFGDDWPGRIPGQMIAHLLFYFSKENDLIFDPMAGGGVTPDTCLAFNRRCWAFDMADRPNRPEIEPHTWRFSPDDELAWPVSSKGKPDLIIFDPPDYDGKDISSMSKIEYLDFLEKSFAIFKRNAKKGTRLAFINTDWRDFENTPAMEESPEKALLTLNCFEIFKKTGWKLTDIIHAPLSPDRFSQEDRERMQKKKILGVTARYVLVFKAATDQE